MIFPGSTNNRRRKPTESCHILEWNLLPAKQIVTRSAANKIYNKNIISKLIWYTLLNLSLFSIESEYKAWEFILERHNGGKIQHFGDECVYETSGSAVFCSRAWNIGKCPDAFDWGCKIVDYRCIRKMLVNFQSLPGKNTTNLWSLDITLFKTFFR